MLAATLPQQNSTAMARSGSSGSTGRILQIPAQLTQAVCSRSSFLDTALRRHQRRRQSPTSGTCARQQLAPVRPSRLLSITRLSSTSCIEIQNDTIPHEDNLDVLAHVMSPTYRARFPLFSAVQASVLSSAPASAEPERVFSLASYIKSLRRNRLSPSVLEALVVLKNDATRKPARVVGPSRMWHERVAMAIFVLHGLRRKAALAAARKLPPGTPLDNLESTAMRLFSTPPANNAPTQETPSESADGDAADDEDESDDGVIMAQLLDAGVAPDNDGNLVLDDSAINALEGEEENLEGHSDTGLDDNVRQAAREALLDELDGLNDRRSHRLSKKARQVWTTKNS